MESFNTITKEELSTLLKQKGIPQMVNVLEPKDYDLGFIPGSKRIPLSELETRVTELDKSKETIVYCSGAECTASKNAAKKLQDKGFKVRVYEGGMKEWKESGLPMEHISKAA